MRAKIKFLLVIFFTVHFVSFSQNFSNSWIGHFSYLDIKDISQGENKIYGAATNAIFSYNIQTFEIEKLSTINGLSGETISNIEYIEEKGVLLIGFENGLMQVYQESSNDFITIIDIFNKPSIPPNNKKINHFNVYNGIAYISTDYGVSLYDIDNLEFGDTYFIGNLGSQVQVRQTTVFNDYIYTATNNGIRKALIDNPNLIDYNQWEQIGASNWIGIESIEDKLFATNTNRRLYDVTNDVITQLVIYPQTIVDTRSNNNRLIITTEKQLFVYDYETLNEIAVVNTTEDYPITFTAGIYNDSTNNIYIGTNRITSTGQHGFGILKTNITNTTTFEEIHPTSPLLNRFFKIDVQSDQIWGVHGGHSADFNPYLGIRRTGVSHFINEQWNNIPYKDFEEIVTNPWALSYLSINPFNPNEVYISSSFSGVILIKNGIVDTWYNATNSTIVPFLGQNYFVHASIFDDQGSYWVMNGRYEKPLNRFENGQWVSYSFPSSIAGNLGFADLCFSENGAIFTTGYPFGLIGYTDGTLKNITSEEQNMPSRVVNTVETDKQGNIWLGTTLGLRVIYNTEEFFSNPDYQVSNIVVIDDDIPRELLFQQFISDIEVDGSNNKWIATIGTGVYYFSSDGQETIYHFTKDNSPLPSNDILDIAINEINGNVYFATENGLVAFKSDSSAPDISLENAYIYPNPVRPNFNLNIDKVKIKGLTENVNIKITDIEGNLVTEAESRTNTKFKGYNLEIDGGTALWDGKNLANKTVASGVYLIMITDLDSIETKVLKVMIIR